MKILVIEDEAKTGDYLKQGLSRGRLRRRTWARDGIDGLHLALTEAHDLAILDVMLPGWMAGRCCREFGGPGRIYPYCS